MDVGLLAFVLSSVIITITPGQDMALVTKVVMQDGKRAGLWTVCGMSLAALLYAGSVAVGVANVLRAYPWTLLLLEAIGACYLGWLGVSGWVHLLFTNPKRKKNAIPTQTHPQPLVFSGKPFFKKGFFSTITNAKVFAFYFTILPPFIGDTSHPLRRSLLLVGINLVIGFGWMICFVHFLGKLRKHLLKPNVKWAIEFITSIVLSIFSLKLFMDVASSLWSKSHQ